MRIAFAGTPVFAATILQHLIEAHEELEIVAVYSQPDRPKGRGRKIVPTAVKEIALANNLTVMQPPKLSSAEDQTDLKALNLDLLIVVAYGLLLPQAVLDMPKHGCVNVHASLLPRWRGAAPIERALIAGDSATGVTIMQMDAGLDTGAMLIKETVDITNTDTSASLESKLATAGRTALSTYLNQLKTGCVIHQVQNGDAACYAKKISKEEAQLDWQTDANTLHRSIRGFNPRPVAYTVIDDHIVRIWEAVVADSASSAKSGTIIQADKKGIRVSTATNDLVLTVLQVQGGKVLTAQQLLNGKAEMFQVGKTFLIE